LHRSEKEEGYLNKIADETKESNRKITNEVIRIISDSAQNRKDVQDQSLQAAVDIADMAIKIQKEIMELSKPGWLSYMEKMYERMPQLRSVAEAYQKAANTLTDNLISSTKLATNVACANIDASKVALNHMKSNANVLLKINVNAAKTIEQISKDIGLENVSVNGREEGVLERYPSVRFPKKMALEYIAGLEVTIKAAQQRPSGDNTKSDENQVPIDVIISRGSFEIIGEDYGTILVPINAQDSKPLIFSLRAKEEGTQNIEVKYLQNGTYLGKLKVSTIVVDSTDERDPSLTQPALVDGYWRSPVSRIPTPDITLYIIEKTPEEEYNILITATIKSKLYTRSVGPIKFTQNPESGFRAIFKDIENTDLPPNVIDDRIKAKGMYLYDQLFPKELKELYWEIRDDIKSIRIISQEPWIPWEIIKPYNKVNGRLYTDKFLCEQYSFSRWLEHDEHIKHNELKKIKVVIPTDTGLTAAIEEHAWIKLFGANIGLDVSSISTYTDVKDALDNPDFDILHFSTHGQYNEKTPQSSTIDLQGDIQIRPENLVGVTISVRDVNPIVFLNVCEAGAQGFSLTGIQSWATNFIQAGAGSFIGPLWSVSDETAFNFVQALYKQLSNGLTPLGEAVRRARNDCKRPGDPSWLAYQLYGHPNSIIKLGSK
jgi:CHAT domain